MKLSFKKKNMPEAGEAETQTKKSRSNARGAAALNTSKKAKRFVLILGDEGAILVFMQGKKVVRRLFAPSSQQVHTEAMRELMSQHAKVPFYLLADVIDQQYVLQSFPPVSKMSVGGLVKRRLDRDFQAEDMKGALPMGREATGRKEWKYLLVALAKTPLLSDWLDFLLDVPNYLSGIYLLPIEAVNYLAVLNHKTQSGGTQPWQLLFTHNKVSGFRQVVIHEGKLVFTRVSQAIDDGIPAVIAGNIEQEIINTMEYLKRLGFTDNNLLEATVVVSADVIESLDLKRFGFSLARALTPLDVADALGLEQAALSADRFGDVVLASTFGLQKKRVLRFANAYIQKLDSLYKARTGIKVVAALIALGLIGLSLSTVSGIFGNYSARSKAEEETRKLQVKLASAQKIVDGLGKDVAFKTAVVATLDSYFKNTPTALDLVRELQAFNQPQQRVISFNWSYADESLTKAAGEIVNRPGGVFLPVNAKVQFDMSLSGNSAELMTTAADGLFEQLKTTLPRYDITAEPFPWKKSGGTENANVFQANQKINLSAQDVLATFKFNGLKEVPPQNGAPPIPPTPNAGGAP